MAASDATAIPIKNQAYRVTFPILDADGDLVTGAAGLDSEVSKDAGTFADVTAEATEIATASGMYYLDLTATEMNADTVAIIVKTTTTGAKTTPIVLYPAETTDIPVNVTAIGGVAQSATDLKDMVDTGYDPATHKIQSDLIYIHGTALTETDGQLAAAFKKLFDVATPLLVASTVMRGTDSAALATTALSTATWTAARAGALTDWINGGRLDNLLDAIPTTAMRGTDNATLAATWTDARAGYLDNLSAGAVALAAGVDLTSIHGAALTETVNGYLAAAFTKLFDVATPLLVASDAMRGTDGANTTVPDAAGVAATPAEVATALTDINLDHLVKIAVDTNWATTVHLDSVIGQIADVGTSATFDRTTDALEAIRDRGDAEWATATGFNTVVPDVAGTLATYDPPTNTEMIAAFTEIKGATWAAGTDTLEHIRNKQTDIEEDTAEIGAAGAGLTALGDTRIGNLDAAVSSRLAPAGTLATVTDLTNAPTAGDLTTTMKTSVNDQVVDVIKTDTTSEMSQGAPPATPTLEEMNAYIYFKLRNKGLTTATEDAMYDDAGTTKLMKATLSDNGTTLEKSEYISGV